MNAEPNSFDPSETDGRAFRDALGRFATGVTVVTCDTDKGPIGITANSFASVSLDPPLVLWSPAKKSARYPFFRDAQHFAVHVLGEEQVGICEAFAKSGDGFGALDWAPSAYDVPLIAGCLSQFECKREAVYDGGDHSVILARVTRVTTRPGAPLMFFGGSYGRFSAPN